MKPFKLTRTRQCQKCPWKKSTNPHEIPNGYSATRHRNLAGTIAEPGSLNLGTLRVFACHESPLGKETYCLGWLMHQLGDGNNIMLRIAMRTCENLDRVRLDGPQHERFEDTLP